MNTNSPLIVAHRGASAFAPENTFAAFQKAIEAGAEGVEFDVRLAKDGVPVVFHDAKLKRIGQKTGGVSDFTSRELCALDAGSWFNLKNPKKFRAEFSAETVPTLAQLFNFLKNYNGLIYVELKHSVAETASIVETVSRVIRKSDLLPKIVVKSFDLEAIYRIRRKIPEIRTAALFAPKLLTMLDKEKHLLNEAREAEADEISIHYSLATQSFIKKARQNNFKTTIWTVNSLIWIRRAIDLGVNTIITNNPAKLLAQKQKLLLSNTNK